MEHRVGSARLRGRHARLAATLVLAGATIDLGAPAARAAAQVARLRAAEAAPLARTSPAFLSFAIDIIFVTGGEVGDPNSNGTITVGPYDFRRRNLNRLVHALVGGRRRPAYLRISGTQADHTYYDLVGDSAAPPQNYDHVLTKHEWDEVNRFARRQGLTIAFGINAGKGPRTGPAYEWDPANARALLTYTRLKHYPLGALEFGNEPNVFYGTGSAPSTYSASAYAADIQAFNQLREQLAPDTVFAGPGPFLVPKDPQDERPIFGIALGPEAHDVMPLVPGIYSAVGYHMYPAFSERCPFQPKVPSDPLDPAFLDSTLLPYAYMADLRDHYNPGVPLWITETSSAACGGKVGYSDRFIESFYWLNLLGQMASRGVNVVVRQTLSGGTYGLLTQDTLDPNPDYWASLLWRRLMGPVQLDPPSNGVPSTLRIFAACTPQGAVHSPGGFQAQHGQVTLLALNISRTEEATLNLEGTGSDEASLYLVSSPDLSSKDVRLNGQPLQAPDGRVPKLRAQRAPRSITLPPASYAFIVQPAQVSACGAVPPG
jgi:heparanase 1